MRKKIKSGDYWATSQFEVSSASKKIAKSFVLIFAVNKTLKIGDRQTLCKTLFNDDWMRRMKQSWGRLAVEVDRVVLRIVVRPHGCNVKLF